MSDEFRAAATADSLTVAYSGTIDRDDKCRMCGGGMMFRMKDGRVETSFCAKSDCLAFLMELGVWHAA